MKKLLIGIVVAIFLVGCATVSSTFVPKYNTTPNPELKTTYYMTEADNRNTYRFYPDKDYDVVRVIFSNKETNMHCEWIWVDENLMGDEGEYEGIKYKESSAFAVKLTYDNPDGTRGCWAGIFYVRDFNNVINDADSIFITGVYSSTCESYDETLQDQISGKWRERLRELKEGVE